VGEDADRPLCRDAHSRRPWCRLLLAGVLVSLVVGGCGTEETERRVEEARGVGEIRLFSFEAPPSSAHEWLSNDGVVFLTLNGTATVDLKTGDVTERVDSGITPSNQPPRPVPSAKLPPGARYGPWEVTGDSRFLRADESGDVRCAALLVSPDGKHAACTYIVTDRMAESSSGGPAVIRLSE